MRLPLVCSLLALVLAGGSASADQPPIGILPSEIPDPGEPLVHPDADARQAWERGDFTACGQRYTRLFGDDPAAVDGDIWLHAGGRCFERAGKVGSALQLYDLLLSRFPRSPNAMWALLRAGRLRARIGQWGEAADHLEDFAKRFGGQAEARDALLTATRFRMAIEQHTAVRDQARFFARRYRRSQPALAESVAFAALDSALAADGSSLPLRVYLKEYRRAPPVRRLIARTRLALLEWDEACPTGDALCVRPGSEPRRKVDRCSGRAAARLVAVPRRRGAVAAAGDLEAAIADWEKDRTGLAGAAPWIARARLALADRSIESLIATTMPAGLDFDPRNKARARQSNQRMQQFLVDVRARYQQLRRDVAAVNAHGGTWQVAAGLRAGWAARAASDAIFDGPIPADIGRGAYAADKREAYCGALQDMTDALRDEAVDAFAACLDGAARVRDTGPWAEDCRRELAGLAPDRIDPRDELLLGPEPVTPPPVDVHGKPMRVLQQRDDEALLAGWAREVQRRPADVQPRLQLAAAQLRTARRTGSMTTTERGAIERHLQSARAVAPTDAWPWVLEAELSLLPPARVGLAVLALERATALDPDAPGLAEARAHLAWVRGDGPAAARAYAAMSEPRARANRGLLALRAGDVDEALPDLRAAVAAAPTHARLLALAAAQRRAGQLARARDTLARARDRGQDEALFNSGVLYVVYRARTAPGAADVAHAYRRGKAFLAEYLARAPQGAAAARARELVARADAALATL